MVVVDLKHLGLILSVGVAVALRFFSDFSFATIQHQAALANVSLSGLTSARLWALGINTLSYQLQRDWFNLSPQALPEIFGMAAALMLAYVALRRAFTPEASAASVLIAAPFVALLASILACAWVLARPVNAA